ncbi:hypothetical protein AAG906_000937 [Vitis piasezkii]
MTIESDNIVVIELALATPHKFSGLNFKRWQQKMLFYLTTLNLARFLTEDAPKLKEDEHDIQVISAIDAWKHSDFLCRNYVMNGLADSLYNVYSDKKTAKELWESLDRNINRGCRAKKFVVGRLDYKMVDSKTCETFQVATIIEKLPPAWKDFKNYLKHKRKEMSIEDLIIRLRIEEDNRRSEKKGAHTLNEAKANFVEHGQSSKAKTNNNKGKGSKLGPKGGISKKPKFQGKCFNCGKQGHKSVDCRLPKKNKPKEANVIDDITRNVSDIDLTAVVSEVNLVGSNPKEWWIDTGATRHVCSIRKCSPFLNQLRMGKSVHGELATSEIKGQGKLTRPMFYMYRNCKNLVSGSFLNNHRFRLVFDSNKVVLSKSGMYVGKGYMSDGMWKLNVMTIIKYPKESEKTPYELWKGRKPSYTYLRMWGCLAKTIDCIFIGYAHNSNAYRFLVYESNIPDIHKNTIMESRNASFFEDSQDQNEEVEVEPRRSKRAVNSTEGLMWKEAIKSEIDSILQNHTWELVDLPPGCKPLSSKWIFKRKMKVDGSIDKYKARLIILTHILRDENKFHKDGTCNSALRNLEIHQMDVKTAFLNGDLDEEIYMEQPEGFSAPGQEKKVCKLCVYVKDTEHGYVIVCLYVDDMLIVGSDDKMITSTKNMLNSRFDMKDMGLADVILGIKIKRTSDELILSQSHYVDKILGKFDKDNSGVARTPVDVTLHLSKNKGESVSQVEYSRIIGSLMYLMSSKHWQGIIRVLKYLRFTRDYGLHYTRYPAVLEGYSDANWISNVKDSKSHSGYVFTLEVQGEWLRHFLEDIPRWSKPVPPICIHCDSQSAIGRAQSNMYNGKSRHIRRRHNTIRQLLSTGVISVDYVKSKDNIADPLTKGLNRELVEKSSRGMGLKPIKE